MKTITEEKEVFGELYTDTETFKLLKLFPNAYDVPTQLREQGFLSFYVLDYDGFAKSVYVKSQNILIKPYLEVRKLSVAFLVEENIKVDSLE